MIVERTRRNGLLLVAALVVIAITVTSGLTAYARRDGVYENLDSFVEVLNLVEGHYVEEVGTQELFRSAFRGLVEAVDPLGYFEPAGFPPSPPGPAEAGLLLAKGGSYPKVIAVRHGSPAQEAGIRPGAYLHSIADYSAKDLSLGELQYALRGEPGAPLTLTVATHWNDEPRPIELTLARVPRGAVTHSLVAPKTGLLRPHDFSPPAADQCRTALAALTEQEATHLILDLRGNPGGEVEELRKVAGLLGPSDPLGTIARSEEVREPLEPIAGATRWSGPVVVVVDQWTQAEAEMLAAGLQGRPQVRVAGRRTMGNGYLREWVSLEPAGRLWLSTRQYLRRNGEPLQAEGVQPDVEWSWKPEEEESVIQRAVELSHAAE